MIIASIWAGVILDSRPNPLLRRIHEKHPQKSASQKYRKRKRFPRHVKKYARNHIIGILAQVSGDQLLLNYLAARIRSHMWLSAYHTKKIAYTLLSN
jgi:hypothetical protein